MNIKGREIHIRLSLYALLPDKYTDYIEEQAHYARIAGYRELTGSMLIGYMALLLIALVVLWRPLLQSVIILLAATPFSLILPYAVFSVLAERRKRAIERVLPDALLLMSANIESGLTVDKAFLLSARDEFGPLADDIQRTAMKMFGGMPVEEALEELERSTNSELFSETLNLLIDGLNSGGEVSSLLESSAEDIRKSLHLREEIEANVKMYSMFILIASLIGAPFLFGVSTFLAETTADMWSGQSMDIDDMPDSSFMTFQEPEFNIEFFRLFAIASLVISNAFAALIISLIKSGTVKNGFKFIPVFTVVAVVVFLVADVIIQNALSGII